MAARCSGRRYLAVFFAGGAAGILMHMEAMYTGFQVFQVWRENQTMLCLTDANLADLFASTAFGSHIHGDDDVGQRGGG